MLAMSYFVTKEKAYSQQASQDLLKWLKCCFQKSGLLSKFSQLKKPFYTDNTGSDMKPCCKQLVIYASLNIR